MNWKDKVSPLIKNHLEKQIGESLKEKSAYDSAKNSAQAQLWISLAYLSKEVFDLSLKVSSLEKKIENLTVKKVSPLLGKKKK